MRRRSLPLVVAAFAALVAAFVVARAPKRLVAAQVAPSAPTMETATFAGGCFWCMQPAFDKVPGVVSTTVGYTGGMSKEPTYDEVSAGGTGHAESIQVVFDASKVSYGRLLDVFWRNVDPTTPDREFCDVGHQYRSAIFFHGAMQEREALASKRELDASKRLPGPVVTEIVAVGDFWPAEEYHQKYYEKNPIRYHFYRHGCGRDDRLRALWGDEAGGGSAKE